MSVRQPERCRFVVARQKAFVETMLCGCTIVSAKPSAIVSTIEPSEDALSMEEVVKLFSTAFKQICGLHEVDKLVQLISLSVRPCCLLCWCVFSYVSFGSVESCMGSWVQIPHTILLIWDPDSQLAVKVLFGPEGILCEEDESDSCKHVHFALSQTDVQEVIRKRRREGWDLPQV